MNHDNKRKYDDLLHILINNKYILRAHFQQTMSNKFRKKYTIHITYYNKTVFFHSRLYIDLIRTVRTCMLYITCMLGSRTCSIYIYFGTAISGANE